MLGKKKLKHILSQETGIPINEITRYGIYECFGSVERLVLGGRTIAVRNGEVKLYEPTYREKAPFYKSKVIKDIWDENGQADPAIGGEIVGS